MRKLLSFINEGRHLGKRNGKTKVLAVGNNKMRKS